MIIVAKNNAGAMQLNEIMSEAHSTGFYYRPRIDDELLFSVNPHNFIVTSACVAGIWDEPDLLLSLKAFFGPNFFIELQDHGIQKQKEVNEKMVAFSKEAGIPIIHANDSHYIYPQDSKYRDIYLHGKQVFHEFEENMVLDYPDVDTIFKRYRAQGILSKSQVQEALENTRVFDECEDLTYINDDIKLPSVSDTPIEDLKKIINANWKKEMSAVDPARRSEYKKAIREEVDIIDKTNMANYFLIDYNVVKTAQEKYGGKLTNTGRGSAPSFYTTKMLGLTDIDRVAAPITLFPSRFMSVERILGSRSLPDIDLNTADREPFIKATEDLLGKENCAWMLAWKPLQDSSAFRLYCKGIGMDISEYDDVAMDLDSHREDKKWKEIIEDSKHFIGVIESVAESPCSMLLYDHPVKDEIGLVRMSGTGKICCMLDGYNCDKYKYLKNDYLAVSVWGIIKDVCELAGIPIPTIREMDSLLDEKTYEIYEKGLTCTINQADSDFGTSLAMRYKPHSVSEMSAFVAIIRPGCASLLQDFIDRKPYTTGVPELDDILVEGNHRMIYQELIMKYLIWLGIPETGSYDIIKKIAKKKFKEPELKELKERLMKGWVKRVGKEDGFEETWSVVEDAARYSFNASHSLSYAYDSLYGAYLKSHYPLEYYTVALNYYANDEARTLRLTNELQYFGLKIRPIKFRYSKAGYVMSKEDNSIYKGIGSIKYMNEKVADEMYELKDKHYDSFVDLLYDLKKTSINSRQLRILIELDFFDEFGDAGFLLASSEIFYNFYDKKQFAKGALEQYGVSLDEVRELAESDIDAGLIWRYTTTDKARGGYKETEKQFSGLYNPHIIKLILSKMHIQDRTLREKIQSQIEHLGYIDICGDQYKGLAVVIDVDTKYSPKLKMHSMKSGATVECKIAKKTFSSKKLKVGDIISVYGQTRKPKMRRTDSGSFEPIPDTKEVWITKYEIRKDL